MNLEPATFLRFVDRTEDCTTLVNDANALTWQDEAEHLPLESNDGRLPLARGGRDGAVFRVTEQGGRSTIWIEVGGQFHAIARVLWHTHPRVTGPLQSDLDVLSLLNQAESWIYEIGVASDGTRIAPRSQVSEG